MPLVDLETHKTKVAPKQVESPACLSHALMVVSIPNCHSTTSGSFKVKQHLFRFETICEIAFECARFSNRVNPNLKSSNKSDRPVKLCHLQE